jgi:uncharacterized protein (TIGR00251 family)
MADELFDVEPAPSGANGADEAGRSGQTIVLRVHVRPGAGRSQVAGRREHALHVRVAPPPQDGRANAACIELLADLFDIARARISLVGGERSTTKRFRIEGVDPDAISRQLTEAIERVDRAKGSSRRFGR